MVMAIAVVMVMVMIGFQVLHMSRMDLCTLMCRSSPVLTVVITPSFARGLSATRRLMPKVKVLWHPVMVRRDILMISRYGRNPKMVNHVGNPSGEWVDLVGILNALLWLGRCCHYHHHRYYHYHPHLPIPPILPSPSLLSLSPSPSPSLSTVTYWAKRSISTLAVLT